MIKIKDGVCTECGMTLDEHAYSYPAYDTVSYVEFVRTVVICPVKLCIQCGKMQPISLFSRYTMHPHHTCKDCIKARATNRSRVEKILEDDPRLKIIY